MKNNTQETKFLQELILYAASAALSCLVLFTGLRMLDPNREASKKAMEHKKEIAKRLGRPLIKTNPYEDVIACDVINPNHIDVEFDSIGGLEEIKEALYELVILPLRRPELFSRGKLLCPQKGVLLYGPPGTGKTMLAKAIAKESGASFINVRISNLMSKWFGDAQKLVAAVFSLAYKLQPAIIFIDEVDSFLGQRKSSDHEAMTNMKTEFMALWDGFTTDQNACVMVLAATNRPSELDEAILRRLPQAFEIGYPDRRERAAILKVILKGEKVENGVDYDRIAALCDGYTGSDLFELCKKAAYYPIRDLLKEENKGASPSREPRPLSQSDLEKVIATTTKTMVATSEYTRLNSQIAPWSNPCDPVQAAIGELSKIMASQLYNLKRDELHMNSGEHGCGPSGEVGESGTAEHVGESGTAEHVGDIQAEHSLHVPRCEVGLRRGDAQDTSNELHINAGEHDGGPAVEGGEAASVEHGGAIQPEHSLHVPMP